MKQRKQWILYTVLLVSMVLFCSMPVFAAELTEAEVEQAVASQGKEAVTGNVFIWFLCAMAFLKVSQKIDSFLASLGVNVGNTGGNMLGELLIAGRSLSGGFHRPSGGGRARSGSTSPGDAAVGGSFLAGGLAGSVGRQVQRSAVNAATGYTENSSIGNSLYQSSLKKGGDFSNQVISNIARGNYGQVGSIKGDDAAKAFTSYMGLSPNPANQPSSRTGGTAGNGAAGNNTAGNPGASPNVPSYTNMEIGGGRITGTETTKNGSRDFAMYNKDQYMAPPQGEYDTVQSVDGTAWYKQYAQDAVSKTPYKKDDGKIAYHESLVQKLPPAPPRKDRV